MAREAVMEKIAQKLKKTSAKRNNVGRSADNMTLSENSSGSLTEIARYTAPRDMVLRNNDPVKIVPVAFEEFTDNGSDDEETFSLSNNFVTTPNTRNVVLFDDGSFENGSINSSEPGNDQIKVDTDGNDEKYDVYYTARDPGRVVVKLEAPQAQGAIEETILETPTSAVIEQDLIERPQTFNLHDSALAPVVPENWDVAVYADVPYQIAWNGDDSAGSGEDTSARNLLFQLPLAFIKGQIEGLAEAKGQDILKRSN